MTDNSSINQRITDLWWLGIRLWYNEQDFLQAMQVWDEAIEESSGIDDDDDDDVEQQQLLLLLEKEGYRDEEQTTIRSSSSKSLSLVAPLMIFLAGCYLDAGEIQKARKLCRRVLTTRVFEDSLSSSSSSSSSSLAACAMSEYVATFQEDKSISNPCKIAYQIVKWSIDKKRHHHHQQQQQSTNHNINNGTMNNNNYNNCWVDPYQRPGYFYPFLFSQAVYSREEHPNWCRVLEDHFPIIREEFYEQLQSFQQQQQQQNPSSTTTTTTTMPQHWPKVGAGDHRDGSGKHDASVVNNNRGGGGGGGGDWRELVLFGSGARPGSKVAPRTRRLLEQIAPTAVHCANEGIGEIIFSVLGPNTHIAPHCASTNLRLTAHMGIQVPTTTTTTTNTTSEASASAELGENDECCYIQVADQKLTWQEGKIIVFDDSYQHEVHNNTNDIRAVLLMRFWHPNLSTKQKRYDAIQYTFTAKETDQQQRCNPPLPPPSVSVSPPPPSTLSLLLQSNNNNGETTTMIGRIRRNKQGMNQQICPICCASGYESIRLVEEDLFVCLCGREVR